MKQISIHSHIRKVVHIGNKYVSK